MAPGAPAAAVVADAEPDDVAMLDGNTIEVAWPQTRDGVEKMRTRVGTVYYRPKQQRNRFENVYLIEFERRPGTPRTAKGPRLRKTRWEKLRPSRAQVCGAALDRAPEACGCEVDA